MSATGQVYVADYCNDRVQVFRRRTVDTNAKAIIVAGGGAFPGNTIWDATQMNANFAYRALTYQGFTKESICYLTSDTDLDLDDNGVLDDVDGDATWGNLRDAVTGWAADADSLVVYLVDHGGDGTFRLNDTEVLSASELDAWLDALQATVPCKVIVVIDACNSGSFVSALTPPLGRERIVLTSCGADESAYFVTSGSVSFSSFSWTQVLNGLSVEDAFSLTSDAIGGQLPQTAQLDGDGDGPGPREGEAGRTPSEPGACRVSDRTGAGARARRVRSFSYSRGWLPASRRRPGAPCSTPSRLRAMASRPPLARRTLIPQHLKRPQRKCLPAGRT